MSDTGTPLPHESKIDGRLVQVRPVPTPVTADMIERAARVWVHEDMDSLYDAEHDDTLLIRDAAHRLWLAWETEDGSWFAVRSRDEDDAQKADVGDPWRPIGPSPISLLHYPLTVVRANAALTGAAPRTITPEQREAAIYALCDRDTDLADRGGPTETHWAERSSDVDTTLAAAGIEVSR